MRILTWRTKFLPLSLLFYIVRDTATKEVLCNVSTPTTISRRNVMLYDHNLYRSRVAQGYPLHIGGRRQPIGSNIYKVKWSCDLEKLAYIAVRDCSTRKIGVPHYGQNYEFFESFNDYAVENPYSIALSKWVEPMVYKSFNNSEVTFEEDDDLRPFANIVRGNTTRIGCSQKICSTFAAVACFYNSPDIREGQLIYMHGKGCKVNSDCKSHSDSTCDALSSLCGQPKSEEDRELIHFKKRDIYPFYNAMRLYNRTRKSVILAEVNESIQPTGGSYCPKWQDTYDPRVGRIVVNVLNVTAPAANSKFQKSTCSKHVGMTNELREIILLAHNEYRSLITKGLVRKIFGNIFPQAGNMIKLKYNCTLEALALSRAYKCSLSDIDASRQKERDGNEAFIRQENVLTTEGAIRWAIRGWWSHIHKQRTALGRAVTFKDKHTVHPVSQSTQIAWAETRDVGCGIAKCGQAYNFICQYYPRGNHINHTIYIVGEPCTRCPLDTTCEQATGLCMLKSAKVTFTGSHIYVFYVCFAIVLHSLQH